LAELSALAFGQRISPLPMPEIRSTAIDQAAPDHLISFLKAIPD
jgi:hypothetical protein